MGSALPGQCIEIKIQVDAIATILEGDWCMWKEVMLRGSLHRRL